jgi:hypothetical protein
MPSPFSKQNLPVTLLALLFITVLIVIIFKPFKSSYGSQRSRFGEMSSSMSTSSGGVSLKESQIKGRLQNDNGFGSLTVMQATDKLDAVIQKAKNLSPNIFASINDQSNTLNNLYSQVQNTLPETITFRNNINPKTNVNDILKESYNLSYPLERLMAAIKAMAAP